MNQPLHATAPNPYSIEALKTIYQTLETIEVTRTSPLLTPEEKKTLEKSAVALRKKEREIIGNEVRAMISQLTPRSENLEALSRAIRKKVKEMGKAPVLLDKVSKILLQVVEIADRTDSLLREPQ